MKTLLRIIFYTFNLISALSLIPVILITSDFHPAQERFLLLPIVLFGDLSFICLPLSVMWAVYHLIACAAEDQWKKFAYSLVGFVAIIISTVVAIDHLSGKSIRAADQVALTVLQPNTLGYAYDIDKDAKDILDTFRKAYDASAIQRRGAIPQLGIYLYVALPRYSPGFLVDIDRHRKVVHISARDVGTVLKDHDQFEKVDR